MADKSVTRTRTLRTLLREGFAFVRFVRLQTRQRTFANFVRFVRLVPPSWKLRAELAARATLRRPCRTEAAVLEIRSHRACDMGGCRGGIGER
jgi:hypothetical protein